MFKKANHEKQIYSLIKLNKARIKMRKALGFTLYDNTIEVIESQWLLAEFLNKDKLKVSHEKLKDYAENLEDKVKEATKEIEEEKENALNNFVIMISLCITNGCTVHFGSKFFF